MKKKEALLTLTALAVLGLSGCGTKELALVSDHVEVELGSELDTTVTNYVTDEKVAEDAALDFSAVDTSKVGTYTVPVTYNDQTASFEVEVVDTVAPVVVCEDTVTVEVNTPLSAESVITSVTELSGAVEVTIAEPEVAVDEEATEEATEMVESTELAEDTEAVELEATEVVEVEETEEVESTEATEEATEQETAIVLEPFTVGDVLCANDYIIINETGEYDVLLTVADASGNTAEALIHIVVGEAPTISGVEDITVTVGADEVDYLDGVTAVDCNGNDITDKVTCDSSIVDLDTVGEYGITYTVVDENGFEAYETALVTVKTKNGGASSTASGNGSKPNSTTASGTSSTASGTTTSNTSTSNQSATQNTSSNTGNSTSNTNSQSTTQTPSADTTTTAPSTPSTDTSAQTPSADTSASAPSVDTSAQTPSTDTSTSGGMAVPDGIEFASPDDPLLDNTGTGGEAGGDWAIGGGNF